MMDTTLRLGLDTIAQLPEECWQHIFCLLPFEDRLLTVPVVCKRWRELLLKPSSAWSNISINMPELCRRWKRHVIDQGRFAVAMSWRLTVARRLELLPHVAGDATVEKLLHLTIPYTTNQLTSLVILERVPPTVAYVLSTCTSLLSLEITLDSTSPYWSRETLNFLSPLTRLQRLQLDFESSHENDVTVLSKLVQLRSLNCSLLRGIPQQLNRLTKLESLQLSCFCGDEFPVTVADIVSLTSLVITSWCPQERSIIQLPESLSNLKNITNFSIDVDSIDVHLAPGATNVLSTLTKLQSLAIEGVNLLEWPPVCSCLTQLRALSLKYSEIGSIPDYVTKLQNLRYLNASCTTDQLQVNIPAAITTLTNLTCIEVGTLSAGEDDLFELVCEFGDVTARVFKDNDKWEYRLEGSIPEAVISVSSEFTNVFYYLMERVTVHYTD